MKKIVKIAIVAIVLTAGLMALAPVVGHVSALDLTTGLEAAKPKTGPTDLVVSFGIIINVILYLLGAVSVVMLIYGGVRYTTSGGNAASITAAKSTIIYAIVGLVVAILAFSIANFVISTIK